MPVRAKASLSSGSISSRWPRMSAASQGRGASAQALGQPGPASLPNVSQPAMPSRVGLASGPTREPDGSSIESLRRIPWLRRNVAVIELAGIERPGDSRELTGRFDRLTRVNLGEITGHSHQGAPASRSPLAAIADPGDLHDHPRHDALGIARPVSLAHPRPTHLGDDAAHPRRPRRLGDTPAQIIERVASPQVMVPGAPSAMTAAQIAPHESACHRRHSAATVIADQRQSDPIRGFKRSAIPVGRDPGRHGRDQRNQRGDRDDRSTRRNRVRGVYRNRIDCLSRWNWIVPAILVRQFPLER